LRVPRTIGICRALDAYRYLARWRSFFAGLGFEVVVSEPTTRQTIELGARLAPAELCLPAKVFLGHVLELKGRVDALFLPRLVCQYSGKDLLFSCPKSLALPDMTRALIPGLESAVELVIDEREEPEEQAYRKMAKVLTGRRQKSEGRIENAEVRPRSQTQSTQRVRTNPKSKTQNPTSPDAGVSPLGYQEAGQSKVQNPKSKIGAVSDPVRVGVIAHPYLIHDRVLCLDLLAKIETLGITAVLPEFALRPNVRLDGRFRTNWLFEVELVDSAEAMARDGIDGLLLASSFACGTSAVTSEVVRRELAHVRPGLPVLQVFFDEHSAEAGLATRLESFVELLRMKR